MATVRDVTKRKEDEKNLKERTGHLERLNKEMVGRELKMAELKEEIERLKKKNRRS